MESPAHVCANCGTQYGRHECGMATWHKGTCDVCGKRRPVTEARDFGGLVRLLPDAVSTTDSSAFCGNEPLSSLPTTNADSELSA